MNSIRVKINDKTRLQASTKAYNAMRRVVRDTDDVWDKVLSQVTSPTITWVREQIMDSPIGDQP